MTSTSLHHPDSPRNHHIGIALLSVAMVLFSLLDTGAKWLVQTLPLIEVVWLRMVSHAIVAAVLLAPKHRLDLFRVHSWRWQLLRASMLILMTGLNFGALRYLDLSVTSSIFFSAPILVAAYSSIIMRESISIGEWFSIGFGFLGVLLIVQPNSAEFHPAVFLSIGCAIIFAAFNLLTRRLAATESAVSMQMIAALTGAVVLAPFALLTWKTPTNGFDWFILLGMGFFGGIGHYCFAMAYRFASATKIAPFTYQEIIYMVLLGWLVYGNIPNLYVSLGILVIVGSGIYLISHQRKPV